MATAKPSSVLKPDLHPFEVTARTFIEMWISASSHEREAEIFVLEGWQRVIDVFASVDTPGYVVIVTPRGSIRRHYSQMLQLRGANF